MNILLLYSFLIQILLFFLLISCLIVGDTYLTYMMFNAKAYTCESFENLPITLLDITQAATTQAETTQAATTQAETTQAATTQAATTQAATTQAATTQAATTPKSTSQYSSCYNLSTTQLGFARFKIIVFWILFVGFTGGAIYSLFRLMHHNQILFKIAIAITLLMSIFIIVGGVFMTQYGFSGENNNCFMPTTNPTTPQDKTSLYCYNLNDTELGFARIAVVFGWLYSFAAIFLVGMFLWDANLG